MWARLARNHPVFPCMGGYTSRPRVAPGLHKGPGKEQRTFLVVCPPRRPCARARGAKMELFPTFVFARGCRVFEKIASEVSRNIPAFLGRKRPFTSSVVPMCAAAQNPYLMHNL